VKDGNLLLGFVHASLGRYEDAVKAIKAGIEIEPGNDELHGH
jgi:hypothetical protein